MPTKKVTKSDSKDYKVSEKKEKDTVKKVVVRRRKVELVPTKASAVAIASQANRAKKDALIKKVAASDMPCRKETGLTNTKIPLWVWILFGCSLLLFCVSFYKAVWYPQLDKTNSINLDNVVSLEEDKNTIEDENDVDLYQNVSQDEVIEQGDTGTLTVPETATEVIQEYFLRLSNRQFDDAISLMATSLRTLPDIRDHFTAYRMNPFLDWIEWGKLNPENFQYVKSPSYWKDVYNFDLSYVMNADKSKYEETWEITVSTLWDNPVISTIRCITSKCSYHPIFWPEKFGLM